MLNRMVALYTQAANGTYSETKLTARTNIGTELARLNQEIDRIAKQTDFNGIKPLEKKMTMTFQIGPTVNYKSFCTARANLECHSHLFF